MPSPTLLVFVLQHNLRACVVPLERGYLGQFLVGGGHDRDQQVQQHDEDRSEVDTEPAKKSNCGITLPSVETRLLSDSGSVVVVVLLDS